jgi:hypothetical protein
MSPGFFCRTLPLCRAICTVDRLLTALMTVVAALLLAALLATQAQAHEGHDGTAGVFAPMIEAAEFTDKATLSSDLAAATTGDAKCDGHCCFAGACCLGITGLLPAAVPHLGALDAKSERDADAIPSAAPEGPRRPPKRDI